jgi:regulator of ribonuclease activity A
VELKTADLCDRYAAEIQVCESLFRDYGGKSSFAGPVCTIKCFEDNSRLQELTAEAGEGRVLVVDAGGSMRRAVLGDVLAQRAVDSGWSGVLVYGCVRDSSVLAQLPLGVKALGVCPLRTDKRGEGQRDLPVRFAGTTFRPGDWLYADADGVIVAPRALAAGR